MKIAVILPPKFIFDRKKPNSIETVVRTLNEQSRDEVMIICEEGASAPEVMTVKRIPRYRWKSQRERRIVKLIREFQPDLIEVHQHAPSGKNIARRFKGIPSVLYRHNLVKASDKFLSRLRHERRYAAFSSLIFVSKAARNEFVEAFPRFRDCSYSIANPIDFKRWYAPLEGKENIIAFSGRAAPEKGLQHLVPALVRILEENKDWKAILCLGEWLTHEDWATEVIASLQAFGERCQIKKNIPIDEVKQVLAAAKIAVVPSVWQEPFGLAAIEAHAAGAAVISSGTGGLREASGNNALYLDGVNGDDIYEKLQELVGDEVLRSQLAARGQEFVGKHHHVQERMIELQETRRKIIGQI